MPCNHKAGNQLLNALPAAILARLQPHLEPYDLVLGNEIHVPGDRRSGSRKWFVAVEPSGNSGRSATFVHGRLEIAMQDDRTMPPPKEGNTRHTPRDGKFLSLEEDWELEFWSRTYGVTRRRLADAVKVAGYSTRRVGEQLKRG